MLLLLLVLLCLLLLLLLLLVLRFCVFAALATQGPNQTRTVDELCVQQLLLPGVIRAIAQLAQAARPQAQWAIVVQFTHTRRMRNVGMAGEPSERPRSRRNLLTQRRSNNLLTSRDTATNASQPDGRKDGGHFAICYTADRQRRPVQRQEIRPEARSQRDKQTRGKRSKRDILLSCSCKFLLSFFGNTKGESQDEVTFSLFVPFLAPFCCGRTPEFSFFRH